MKKKLTRKNKAKYSDLVRSARRAEVTLPVLLDLRDRVKEQKEFRRIEKRYGSEEKWEDAEALSVILTVPVVSLKDGRVMHYSTYFSVDMLPPERRDEFAYVFEE